MPFNDLGRIAAFTFLFLLLGHGLDLPRLLAPPVPPADDVRAALAGVQADFRADLGTLLRVSEEYAAVVRHRQPAARVQALHLRTRQAFKRCEYLLEYLEPESVKRYLNGAPLPKTEPRVPEVIVVEPVGLQVLDELAFADMLDYAALEALTDQLYQTLQRLLPYLSGRPLQHRYVFEASREEAIRIFTLGVTGFDTPGSEAGLPEAAAALRLTAQDLLKLGVIDQIIPEPLGGAQRDHEATIAAVGKAINAMLNPLLKKKPDALLKQRRKMFLDMGTKGLAA